MGNYTKNYFLIYSTQALSIILGLMSLFVVMPYLTSNKELYGIYSICLSLTIFYSYADLGFISSGQKYAAEAHIRGEKQSVVEIIGFSGFILFVLLSVIGLVVLFFAFDPGLLIKGISPSNKSVASKLLTILALSSIIFCGQRINQMIYSVRLTDYVSYFFAICGNIVKILSVFYFFRNDKYHIVGYYFFFQIVNLFFLILSLTYANYKYKINFIDILKNMKFRRDTYNLLSSLAYAGFFVTICWIFYYELDSIFISKVWGASSAAIYAVAFSILSMFRTLFGSLYSPFNSRFNYFTGLGEKKGLDDFMKYIIEFYIPFTIVPIIAVLIMAKPFIISWVGDSYIDSVRLVQFFMLGILFTFISTPAGQYIVSLQKTKVLYINSIVILMIYWIGILLFMDTLGLMILSIMKAIALLVSSVYITIIVFNLMKESLVNYLLTLLKTYTIPTLLSILLFYNVRSYLLYCHSKQALFFNIVLIILLSIISFSLFLIFSKIHRNKMIEMYMLIKSFFNKNKI